MFLVYCQISVSTALGVIRDGGIDPANLGKGDWVYYLSDCYSGMGGNIPSVTNRASFMAFEKSQGVRYIIVKAGTGSTNFPSAASPQFTTAVVNAAHSAGLLIFGYNRSYGSDLAGESALVNYVFNCGADGFVFDAEVEWETRTSNPWITNGPVQALALGNMVRSNWPTKFIAYAPAGIISYHSSFPYKEFGSWCDAAMPMIYHYGWENVFASPSGAVDWAEVNWRNWQNGLTGTWTNSIKPIAPVGHVYGPNPPNSGVSHIPDEDVTEWSEILMASSNPATKGGYKGMSYWRADLHGSVQWTNIKALTVGSFTGMVNNIVIDNPQATKSGTWPSTRTFYNGTYYGGTGNDTNSFGTNYYTKAQGAGTAYVQFTPNIVVPGDYNVYEWHPRHTNASASVPHIIKHSTGTNTVSANQRTALGKWNLLGKFNFASGSNSWIRVTDAIAESTNVAIVDGIRLVFVAPTSTPSAPSLLTATVVSSSQINLSWKDSSTNETGFVVALGTVNGGPYTNVTVTGVNVTNYSVLNLTPNIAYYFVVRGTNFLGTSPNSNQATATTSATAVAPSITTQPQSQSADYAESATFSVVASGSGPLSYRWRRNGAPLSDGGNITGALTPTLNLTNVTSTDAANYSVVVTNTAGAVTSSVVALTVVQPVIETQPQGLTVQTGDSATFTVSALGTPPLSYQWRFNNANIPMATLSTYTRQNVTSADAGDYSVVVTASGSSTNSSDAALTILPPPTLSVSSETTNILLSWPALYSNFIVEQSPSPATNAAWSPIVTETFESNSTLNVFVPMVEGSFFRLRKTTP